MTDRPTPDPARTFGLWFSALVFGALVLWAIPGSNAQADTIVINEFQPRNSTTLLDGDGDTPDWIELRNVTSAPIDIGGWTIGDSDARWPIPAGTIIEGGGFLIIFASDKGDPADPDFPGPAGELHANFRLGGSGDTVILINNFVTVDVVTYDTPFAQDESSGRDASGQFVRFTPGDVTPGAPNGAVSTPTPTPTSTPTAPPGPAGIVFNEVMQANTATIQDDGGTGDFEDWFELYNPTCESVDLTGWAVRDSGNEWMVPAGLTMAPNEVLFIWASDKGDAPPAGEIHTNFRLSAAEGEQLFLVNPDGLLVATVNPGPSVADESYARAADGTYSVVTGASVTPGGLNPGQTPTDCTVVPTPTPTPSLPPGVCANQIVINEAQTRNTLTIFDGDGDSSDWVELYNPNATAVDLSGWTISDSGNSFTLAAGTTLAADGYLLIWASDKGDPSDPDFPGPAGEIHASFRLSGSGESIRLTDAAGCEVDTLSLPGLDSDQSFGTTLDGSVGFFNVGWATPGSANGRQQAPPAPTCFAPESPVRINRVVADNDGLLLDGDGDESDFIELYNTGFDPVNLVFHEFSDGGDRWTVPDDLYIDGYGTVIIWASGKGEFGGDDYPGPAGEAHTNFKLSSDGETVTFGIGVCQIEAFEYPPLGSNEAYGYDEQGQLTILVPGTSADECAAAGSVQIVALQAKNESTLADEDGDFGDWIELRNTTDEAIDLTGWVLADDSDTWVVPEGASIEAGAELIVWADEKNRGGAGAALHTNFKLGSSGEPISIGSSLECPVDLVTYPELDDDQVYRRDAEGVFAIVGDAATKADDKDDDKKEESSAPGDITVVGTCIAINELMAKNDSTLADEDGEFGDWIELVNLSDDTIDLSGYVISDEKDSWTIPDGVEIAAGDFLLLWADEADRGGADDELHTNFKLGGGGEPVTLETAEGEVAASLSSYPELEDDESFGVDDEGNFVVRGVGEATPGEGPTLTSGCDFAVGSATASADGEAAEDDADSNDDEAAAGADEQAAATTRSAGDSSLATTGTSAATQALFAQTLLFSGLAMITMARIARRRSLA